MSFSFNDLVAELKSADLLAELFNLCDVAKFPVSAMQPLEAPRTLLSVFSTWIADYLYNPVIRNIGRAQYGDTVVDAGRLWATFWGLSLYGVAPEEATFAQGSVLLTNTKGGNWSFTAGTFKIKNPTTGKIFTNLSTVTLAPWPGSGDFPTTTVEFRADEAGSAATSIVGTINALVTVADGVTCSNTETIVGTDEEPLADFVVRARGNPKLLSVNGPKAAYETILRRTYRADGTLIAVNRVRVKPPTGNAIVRAVVAGPNGAVSTPDVDRLLSSARALVEPWGVTVQVASATVYNYNASFAAYAYASPTLNQQTLKQNGATALVKFINSSPIGGWNTDGGDGGFVYAEEAAAVVSESSPEIFRAANATEDDIVIEPEQVPITTVPSIDITVIPVT